ncbi:MAG: Two-component system, OmpR family, phosphate regulon sensor histidine kinase PhoR [Parcubacteria group bacterium]|nr:Two-component system, OmpR family, phosphate regulon sensor histidine kinase PhoR [Parcubacteria group bacterium]
MTIPYLRQYVAWATALIHRYKANLFFRAATHIAVLTFLLAIAMLVVFGWSIQYAQDKTITVLGERAQERALTGTTVESLPDAIERVGFSSFWYFFVLIALVITAFGFVLGRFALWPTRNSLGAQKQFIGNVAHEIRTPLAIIKTNTEVALFDQTLPLYIKQTFEDTIEELDRISEIINNILTFDTLTRPRNLKMEPVDMGAVATTIAARHQAMANSRGIELVTTIEPHKPIVGNITALEQVVTNLTKNALNYTPADSNGKVEIIVSGNDDGAVSVTVSDTGIGIAQKDLFHIFEPFYRGDTSRARNIGTGSSGLGLAIVNEIIRMHHGTVNIRSALGRGTAIKVMLPGVKTETPSVDEQEGPDSMNEVSVDFT